MKKLIAAGYPMQAMMALVISISFLLFNACHPGKNTDPKSEYIPNLIQQALHTTDPVQRKALLDSASVMSKAILETHSNEVEAYLNYAACTYHLHQYVQSVETYRHALQLFPDNVKVIDGLQHALQTYGSYLGGKTDVEGGISILEEAWNTKPDVNIASNLANYYHALGEHEKTIEWYQKAITLAPKDAQLQYRLAKSYQEAGDDSNAKEAYQKAKDLDPNLGPL